MQGAGDGDMRGIIPRAVTRLAEYKRELQERGWSFDITATYMEIYCDTIRDLLRSGDSDVPHHVKHDENGDHYVTDLAQVPFDPCDAEAMREVSEAAAKRRAVSKTLLNAESSRSHSVFTLHIRTTNVEEKTRLSGKLHMCDLAGSERVEKSGATGQQLKEAQAINKSLSALTDVFAAISKESAHKPFRNSKLTHVLQPALSGDGKTLMLCNVSPAGASYRETLSSLRFSEHVNACELGQARKNVAVL